MIMTNDSDERDCSLGMLLARIGGKPAYAIDVDEIGPAAKLSAAWRCGCIARGGSFARLALEPCPMHAART
jgi:hypothetical protein